MLMVYFHLNLIHRQENLKKTHSVTLICENSLTSASPKIKSSKIGCTQTNIQWTL